MVKRLKKAHQAIHKFHIAGLLMLILSVIVIKEYAVSNQKEMLATAMASLFLLTCFIDRRYGLLTPAKLAEYCLILIFAALLIFSYL